MTFLPDLNHQPAGQKDKACLSAESFWELWNTNREYLMGFCLIWMNRNRQEAMDALSGAMIRAFDHISSAPSSPPAFTRWATRLTRNYCTDLQRSMLRRASGEGNSASRNRSVSPSFESPEETILRRERSASVQKAFDELPLRLRGPLAMRSSGAGYEEIARAFHITPEAARKRTQLGRSRLKIFLASGNSVAPAGEETDELLTGLIPLSEPEPPPFLSLYPVRVQFPSGISREHLIASFENPGRLDQKLAAAERYISRHDNGWKKKRTLAEIHTLLGNWGEAALLLEQVISKQPWLLEARLRLAEIYFLSGRPQDAAGFLNRGEEHATRPSVRLLLSGMAAYYSGNFSESGNLLKQATLSDSSDVRIWIALTKSLLAGGDPHAAREAVANALLVYAGNPEAVCLALDLAHLCRDEAMLSSVTVSAAAMLPDEPVVRSYYLREVLIPRWRGNEKEIRRQLRHLGQVTGFSMLWAETRMQYLWRKGQFSKAMNFAAETARANPAFLDAQLLLARWKMAAAFPLHNDDLIGHLILQFPDSPEALDAAIRLMCLSAHPSHWKEFLSGVHQDRAPGSWMLPAARAMLLAGCDVSAVLQTIRKSLPYLPGTPEAWLEVSATLRECGEYASALEAAARAWNLPERSHSIHNSVRTAWRLYLCLRDTGESAQAREWLEMCARQAHRLIASDEGAGHYWRAKALLELGDEGNAEEHFLLSRQAGIPHDVNL